MSSVPTTSPEAAPPSPCVRVCTLDDDNRCLGCTRTLAEIQRWTRMSVEEQWRIVRRAQANGTVWHGVLK